MAAFAFSVIKELSDDGKVKVYQPGDKLDGLDKDRVKHLLSVGAAATYDRTKPTTTQVDELGASNEALEAKVRDLEAKLAEASKNQGSAPAKDASKTTSGSAGSSSSTSSSK